MERRIANHVKHATIKTLLFTLLILFDFGLLYMDTHFANGDLTESSFTEWGAEIQLMTLTGVLIFAVKPIGNNQSFISLLAACMLVLLIREFNNYFDDYVFDGSCTLLMLVVAGTAIYFSFQHRSDVLTGTYQFIQSPGYGWFICGAVTVFLFSRLAGLPFLWHLILKENYVRIAERFVEEGIESFGYSCMLAGIVEYTLHLNRKFNSEYLNRNKKKILTLNRQQSNADLTWR